MKRISALLLVFVMILGLAACGSSEPAAEAAADVAMQYITPEDAKGLLENEGYVFFDIRKAADSSVTTVPGAQSWDMDAAKEGDAEAGKATMTEATNGLDKQIILVCYSGKRYAQAATNALSAIGYDMSKVWTLEGGFTAWSEKFPELCVTPDGAAAEADTGYAVATTADVEAALADAGSIVLDARLQDSYSGWALGTDARGGHIPGADNFSAFWLTCEYDEEGNLEGLTREEVLAETMDNKGITADKNIIVYDTNGTDAVAVCDYLASKGISNLSVYDANEWLNDSGKELESYPNYKMYVPASVVYEIVNGNVPAGFTDAENIVVLDVAWGDNEESGYVDGHVPTAVHVNTDSYEPPIAYVDDIIEWRLADDDTLLQLLLDNGITKDTCVIITGYEPMATCRMGVICKYFGVEDVSVMSNGMIGWLSAGYELETGVNEPVPAAEFGLTDVPADPDWIDTMDEMKASLGTEGYTLVDNRTWEEFIGESTGYSYHDIAGRIEGAVFGYAGINSSSSVYYYRNVDKSMRNADEIIAMWEECGIDLNDRLAFMCGSGWRVAEILWDARIMGMDNTCIYSDGWIGWSNEGNPYVTGDPTK